jgi:glycosyltransferase involved in cell wall biosynthesis
MTRVDQYVHTFRSRDAVSDEARLFRDRLRGRGFRASIVAVDADPAVAHEVEPFEPRGPVLADAAIYHHATVADVGARLARWNGRKALLYHGVTPAGLFRPYQPAFARLLEDGSAVLRRIVPRFPVLLADSAFGAGELRALAGVEVGVLPFCLDERRFAASPERAERAEPGARWLSVGRLSPNKGLLELVAAFAAYVHVDPAATLTLVGAYAATDPYYWAVRAAIDRAGVFGRVRITGSVDDAELVRWYTESDVYVCLSEHEGFCVPLVEAMHFDLPVVAAARTAIPETLGGAGVLLHDAGAAVVAAVVADVMNDRDRREAVVAAQRARCAAFEPELTLGAFDRMIDALIAI